MQIGSISLLNNAKLAKAVMKDEFLSFKSCVSSHIYTRTKAYHPLYVLVTMVELSRFMALKRQQGAKRPVVLVLVN